MTRNKVFFLIACFVLIGGFLLFQSRVEQVDLQIAQNALANEIAEEEGFVPEQSSVVKSAQEKFTYSSSSSLPVRALGNPDAPVVIEEFASLTCGHCGNFHNTTFKEIKKNYIDTGKVYFVFSDFPLNAPALEATLIAYCLPGKRYFQYKTFLFETMDKWAYEKDYLKFLKQNAKLLGGNEEALDACLADEDMKLAIIKRMEAAGKSYDIKATPSFVINGKTVLTGAQPYRAFQKTIDEILAE